MADTVKLIENMVTFQGEGPDIGKRMILLRYKKCDRVENKKPCPYCDTLVKMRVSNEASYPLENIQEIITNQVLGVMCTGGEPTYDEYFDNTIDILTKLKYPYANVESNGYKLVELIEKFNISKKISNNVTFLYSPKFFDIDELNNEICKSIKLISMMEHNDIRFKVVYDVKNELVKKYLDYLSENIKTSINNNVYLMPQGKSREELIENSPAVFDACEYYKFNFSSREHLIFGFI